ncbi:MAG: DUF3320 domain-containing protein [Thermomicrobiales bacterium]
MMVSRIPSDSEIVARTPRVRSALDGWQSDLLDLSRANRLLAFKPGIHGLALTQPTPSELFTGFVSQNHGYSLYRPDLASRALAVEEQLALVLADTDAEHVAEMPTTPAPPGARLPRADEIVAAGEPKKIETTLYRFRLKSRSFLQEQGTNVLFVAFGILDWVESGFGDGRVLSPLLLMPVRLDRETSLAPYRLTPLDEDVILNPSLVRKMARDFGLTLTLPDEVEENLTLDDALNHLRGQFAAQRDWQIRAEAHLGLFSFAKYAMYADLDANREQVGSHPVVRLISGEETGLPEPVQDLPSAEYLDAHTKPSEIYQVVDADASQQEAIAAVKRGANLIIQGPPGTGKSQTITNIIAESIAAGKTVLFVSEKIAALKVVAKRLAEVGLSEFCLEAHSQDANKAIIIKDLEHTLRADRPQAAEDGALDLERLAALRGDLNAFAHALHDRENPLGISAFHAHGEIARRKDAPIISFILPDSRALTQQRLAGLIESVRRLERSGAILLAVDTHPWHGATVPVFTPQIQNELRDQLNRLTAAADDLAGVQADLYARYGIVYAHSLDAAAWMREMLAILAEMQTLNLAPRELQASWFEPQHYAALMPLAVEAARRQETARAGRATILARFNEAIFGLVTDAFVARFTGPYTAWTRIFSASYRHDIQMLREIQHTQGPLRYHDALAAVLLVRDIQSAEQWLLANAEACAPFGPRFTGLTTDWGAITGALQWTGRVQHHFGGAPPPMFVDVVRSGIATLQSERERLDSDINEVQAMFDALRPSFEPTAYRIGGLPMEQVEQMWVATWARGKSETLAQLEDWIDYREAREEAMVQGLGPFVEGLLRTHVPPAIWQDIFLRQVYTLWLTSRYTNAPALARFRGQAHEETIAEFQRLDAWQLQAASRRVATRLIAKRPANAINPPPRSEPAILLREASKRKRFRPLRKLFADLPNLLPALKPCMLMSPLSVAQFLGESAMNFDLVVFDEASQILPSDAIGAISRGQQIVVVGDNKQLPPTNFFLTALQTASESDDDEFAESPESILDACAGAGMAQKRLRWHYRSRHEDLIAFSNHHFYDDDLVTFPAPDASVRAVEFVHVPDGVYDRSGNRSNRIEARRVVELIVAHARAKPDQSLGVIAFSEAQMTTIQIELDARKRSDPTLEPLLREDGPEGFFIKNLEQVQGDERDVIFFSVGYGFDLAGKIIMNFGPLNREGGERRLNVAVTRARDHVKVIASIQPHDIDRSRTNAKGVHLLRAYLEFAERGPIALLGEVTAEGGEPESPFEAAVVLALQVHGLSVVSQVGVGGFRIDIGIKDEALDRYLLGIECDGATYHSSKTARDRDRLRQQVLENLGWRIHRIWSTDWVKDPDREMAKVLAALEEARKNLTREGSIGDAPQIPPPFVTRRDTFVPPAATESNQPAPAPVLLSRIGQPYVPAVLPWQGGRDSFERKSPLELVPLVEQCVKIEGPVHQDRVMRAIATSFGIARVGSQVRARILAAIDDAIKRGTIERWEPFLWTSSMADPPVREHGGRTIQEIPPDEIIECISVFLRIAFSIGRDDLIAGVAREFGYDRTGNHVAGGIRSMIEWMLTEGYLVDTGGQISLKDRTVDG